MTETKFSKPHHFKNQPKFLYNARIIDPKTGLDTMGGLIIEDGKIADFGNHLQDVLQASDSYQKIDCKGNILAPGLLDIQVHFREPGQTNKETIESGSKSAVSGGVTTVVCQPNTKPVIDSRTIMDVIKDKARDAYCNIKTYAAISKGMQGAELTDMADLVDAGAVGFTDDGLPIMNSLLMRRAFEYSRELGVRIVQHAEDLSLTAGGCINEGKTSFILGVKGIPNVSESAMVARDIEILRATGGKYHVLHVSTRESMNLIERAKNDGLDVTCEVAPHHFMLTDEAVLKYGTNAKMNPPLRSQADIDVLLNAMKKGIVDAIATDHAPHDFASKNKTLADATFGITGLETMLPLSLDLYHRGVMGLKELLAMMTYRPAEVLGIDAGKIQKGAMADLCVIDINHEWVYDVSKTYSLSKNTPFDGHKMKGRALMTFCSGDLVYNLMGR